MKIATWNINSVRLRQQRVANFLKQEDIDVLCLQEIKTENQYFPQEIFQQLGYVHQHVHGQKSYNGVAILSRVPFKVMPSEQWVNEDARHCAVMLGSTELHNFYIPAGGDIPDRNENPKFAHKLDYIAAITQYFIKEKSAATPLIAVGDFNIAPLECDVWSHKQLLDVVSHTPIEVQYLGKMRQSLDFIDTHRETTPAPEKLYSWWSYRNRDWRKSDRGRRLDHIWVTKPLHKQLKRAYSVKDMRDGEQPSDHVPVVMEIKL